MPDPVRLPSSQLDQLPDRDPRRPPNGASRSTPSPRHAGPHRAAYLMRRTLEHAARTDGTALPSLLETDYINTIPTSAEPDFPGDEAMEARITAWNRWNAAAMVTRGSRAGPRRPHRHLRLGGLALRDRLPALLPRQGRRPAVRRPALPPGPRLPRHLRPRLPRRPPHRGPARPLPPGGRRRRPALLPAPAAAAVAVGVPHRLHGPRPALRDLPGALQPLPGAPRHQGHRRTPTSGRSSATARWTSPSRPPPWRWPAARAWTT